MAPRPGSPLLLLLLCTLTSACLNGGTPIHNHNSSTCTCPVDWTGEDCSQPFCAHKGVFNSSTNECVCNEDWQLPRCLTCNGTCTVETPGKSRNVKRSFIYALAFIMGLLCLASGLTAKQCYRMRVEKPSQSHILVPQVVVSLVDDNPPEPERKSTKDSSTSPTSPTSYQQAVS